MEERIMSKNDELEAARLLLADKDTADVNAAAKELSEAIETICSKHGVRMLLAGEFLGNQIQITIKFIKS